MLTIRRGDAAAELTTYTNNPERGSAVEDPSYPSWSRAHWAWFYRMSRLRKASLWTRARQALGEREAQKPRTKAETDKVYTCSIGLRPRKELECSGRPVREEG